MKISSSSEVKRLLVKAHRAGDWEAAKVLSQEKQHHRFKHCVWPGCGVTLARYGKGSVTQLCKMHYFMKRYRKPVLAKECG